MILAIVWVVGLVGAGLWVGWILRGQYDLHIDNMPVPPIPREELHRRNQQLLDEAAERALARVRGGHSRYDVVHIAVRATYETLTDRLLNGIFDGDPPEAA